MPEQVYQDTNSVLIQASPPHANAFLLILSLTIRLRNAPPTPTKKIRGRFRVTHSYNCHLVQISGQCIHQAVNTRAYASEI